MSANHSPSPHHRLRRLKAALLAVSFTLAGILLMMLNAWLASLRLGDWQWLHALPLGELGGTLFGAGLLSTFFEYTFRRDQERAVTERFRQTIREEAPALRDAVIEAFRFDRQDVARIATPELLDDLARTSLGLRFGDPAFGREVYADIRHQAMAAEERWYDARVDATLGIPRGRSSAPTPFFDLRVRWEYTVTPRHRFRKFAVVSDRQRYDQLVAERGETSVWYKPPDPQLPVTNEDAFALLSVSVNGSELPIEHMTDASGQTFIVDLGDEVIRAGEPVVMSFTYRSRLRRDGHMVHFDVDRPVTSRASAWTSATRMLALPASSWSTISPVLTAHGWLSSPTSQETPPTTWATTAGCCHELASRWCGRSTRRSKRPTSSLRAHQAERSRLHAQPLIHPPPTRQEKTSVTHWLPDGRFYRRTHLRPPWCLTRHPCCSPPPISADTSRLPYMYGGAKLVPARRWCRARLLLHQPGRAVVAHRPPAGSATAARPHRQGPEPRSLGPRRRHLHLHLPKVREGRVPPRHPDEPAPAHADRSGGGTGCAGGGAGGWDE